MLMRAMLYGRMQIATWRKLRCRIRGQGRRLLRNQRDLKLYQDDEASALSGTAAVAKVLTLGRRRGETYPCTFDGLGRVLRATRDVRSFPSLEVRQRQVSMRGTTIEEDRPQPNERRADPTEEAPAE